MMIQYAVQSKFYGWALIAIFCSVISSFYYLRLIKIMYVDNPPKIIGIKTGRLSKRLILLLFPFVLLQLLGGFVSIIHELVHGKLLTASHNIFY